jgi:DNA-binding MarR family transcriptional regulator
MQATSVLTKPASDRPGDPSVDSVARDLFAFVTHLHKSCQADVFEAVGAIELSLTQVKVLHHLEQANRPFTVKEVAELVSLSLPAASRAVDDLVRRGFAERHEDPADRRMKRVTITDQGRAAIRRLNAARLSGLEEFVETLTVQQRARLATALAKLLERPDIAACRLEGR